jgi:hypothetical protein
VCVCVSTSLPHCSCGDNRSNGLWKDDTVDTGDARNASEEILRTDPHLKRNRKTDGGVYFSRSHSSKRAAYYKLIEIRAVHARRWIRQIWSFVSIAALPLPGR